jgi:murein DD-endopeptidase MepM/ murein hydrolase activator NlpD
VATKDNPKKSQGISKSEQKGLKVNKHPMNDVQFDVANTILGQAITDGAGPKATKAMVVAAIGESAMTPSAAEQTYGTHKGVFQSDQIPPNETATQAHYFLIGGHSFAAGGAIGAAKDHADWTVGMIAGHVEVSGRNTTASDPFYDVFADEADAIIEAYGGIGDFSESNSSDTVAVSYQFTRGSTDDPHENSWDAAQRLAGEVAGWDLFAVSNRFYFFSEVRLIRQTPVAVIDRTDPDVVVSLRGTLDNTGNAITAAITVFADLFDFHAGEVVKLVNAGPFSTGRWKGRWIVSETTGSRFQPTVDLTLALPQPKGIEPAHETKPGKTAADSTPTSSSGSGLYVNPFKGAKVTASRIDQGVDYVISGPIGAIGDAKIVAILHYSGFGTYLVYQLTAGEFNTNYIYVSEGIVPTVKPGDTVKAGDKIANGVGAIEIGWAQPPSGGHGPNDVATATYLPMAKITGGYIEGQRTAAGDNFNDLLVSLGVVSGTTGGRPTVGHYPP